MNICPNKKLEVLNVSKRFEETEVLKDITLNLNANEFVSLIGPSGSGKTTLFNIIAGMNLPDAGKVAIDGEDYTGRSGRVSYMYQKDLLLPWMNIIDNVSLPLIIKGDSKSQARESAQKYFSIFGIDGFEHKYPDQLSGGMKQRAALLRTYMFSKDIILLDEPFGGLDAITRSKMQDWLIGIFGELDCSILFITHDIDEAIYLSDRIYVLSKRPGELKDEIIVDLEKPRDTKVLTSEKFNAIKRHILNIL